MKQDQEPIIKTLMDSLPQVGKVAWIGVRPERKAPVEVLLEVEAVPGEGLIGDRFSGRMESVRQVTLIQFEHLKTIGSFLHQDDVDPALLRRNIAVSGINLLALKNRRFRIGTAILAGTGIAHPCSRMEEALGAGGYNAVRGHGGITARVVDSGLITLNDEVALLRDTP